MRKFRFFLLCLCSLTASLSAQNLKTRYVVLRDSQKIAAKRITPVTAAFWGSWLVVRDSSGQRKRLFPKNVAYYCYDGRYYQTMQSSKGNKNRHFSFYMLEQDGPIRIFSNEANNSVYYRIQTKDFQLFMSKKSYPKLREYLERCPAYCRAFPPEKRRYATWYQQCEVFNRMCP